MKLWTTYRLDSEGHYIGHLRDPLGRSCEKLAGDPVEVKPLPSWADTRFMLSATEHDPNGFLGQIIRICYNCRKGKKQ